MSDRKPRKQLKPVEKFEMRALTVLAVMGLVVWVFAHFPIQASERSP
jgi:hypothetical protein